MVQEVAAAAPFAAQEAEEPGPDALEASTDQGWNAMVIKQHVGAEDLQLTLHIGDVVVVVEEDESGWAGGYKVGAEGKQGWFPQGNVRPLTAQEEQLLQDEERQEAARLQAEEQATPAWADASSNPSPSKAKANPLVAKADSPIRSNMRAVATPMQQTVSVGEPRAGAAPGLGQPVAARTGQEPALRKASDVDRDHEKLRKELEAVTRDLMSERGERETAEQELANERALRERVEQDLRHSKAHAEQQLRELQAESEQQLRELHAESEQKLRDLRAQAECQVREADKELQELRTQLAKASASQRSAEESRQVNTELARLLQELAEKTDLQQRTVAEHNACKARLTQSERQLMETSAVLAEKSHALDTVRAHQRQEMRLAAAAAMTPMPPKPAVATTPAPVTAPATPAVPCTPAPSTPSGTSPVRQPPLGYSMSSPALGAEANSPVRSNMRAMATPTQQTVSGEPHAGTATSLVLPVAARGQRQGRPEAAASPGTWERELFGSGVLPNRSDIKEMPRQGSVRAQIQAFEQRQQQQHMQQQMQRQNSRGPCPGRVARSSGPLHMMSSPDLGARMQARSSVPPVMPGTPQTTTWER